MYYQPEDRARDLLKRIKVARWYDSNLKQKKPH